MLHTERVTCDVAANMAQEFFGLTLPISEKDLKKKYWEQCLKLHPDHNQNKGKEDFLRMKSAHDLLLNQRGLSGIFTNEGVDSSESKTIEGISLSDLGKGLGPTKNGTNCSICLGQGYKEYPSYKTDKCSSCSGSGRVPQEYTCRACKGSGKFVLNKSGRTVTCRNCKGTRKFKHPLHKMRCRSCSGLGCKSSPIIQHSVCYNCKGTGEIEISNPVLQKGAFSLSNS